MAAYERGVQAIGGTDTYKWEWRVHVGLWAARAALRLEGDFVECGTNYGFMASAIMHHLDWNSLDRTFYLLDKFAGGMHGEYEYASDIAGVRRNFAEWPRARVLEANIPQGLAQATSSMVAFLHIDMNCPEPEIAALTHFWPRLVPGALVLLDDYAYNGYTTQKAAMDKFAREREVAICALPTGQGLILR